MSVAQPLRGRDGKYIQTLASQHAVLFEWVDGTEPQITDNLMDLAERLGMTAAQLHSQVTHWQRPQNFTRPHWDFDAAFGYEKRWGDWRKGLGVEPSMHDVLSKAVFEIERRLIAYGQSALRFNLIHGDLRLANLLQKGDKLTLIDFDDCGHGWLMYDAATMISFHEHEPQAPEMIRRWIAGYREIRSLSREDENAIQTLVIFRRILLLAWLGTHSEIDLARDVKNTFATQTHKLCESYLAGEDFF